jgi:predicted nucleic acid-binding protein
VAGNALLIDTDIFIDYLKGILPARALIDSGGFDLYYSAWTRKELLAKPGLRESERREVEALLGRFRILPVDDAIAGKYWTLVKKYDSQGPPASGCHYSGDSLAERDTASDPQSKAFSIHCRD